MGTNPVVVKSGDQRKKLTTGEKVEIGNNDIIELIPGNYFFKYVLMTSDNTRKRGSDFGKSEDEINRKKIREDGNNFSKVLNLFIYLLVFTVFFCFLGKCALLFCGPFYLFARLRKEIIMKMGFVSFVFQRRNCR